MFLKAVPSDDCIQLPILRLGLPLEFNSFYWWSPNYLALSKTPLYAIHHKLFITAWTCKYCLMSWFSSIWPYHQIFQLCSVQIFIFESIESILEDLKVFCEASNPRLLGQIYHETHFCIQPCMRLLQTCYHVPKGENVYVSWWFSERSLLKAWQNTK